MKFNSIELIRKIFLNWPFPRGKGLLMKVFFPYVRTRDFRFELKNGVTIPGQPIDEYITKWMFIHGYENEKEYAMTHKLIRPGDLILDIGANMGLWSMIPAAEFGDKIKIFAFEPVPSIYQTLNQNINYNRLESSYHCNNIGISDTGGELLFNIDLANSGMGYLATEQKNAGEQIRVKTVRLSNFRRENDIQQVNLVKIDVEGAETQILDSDPELFQSPDAPIITIEIIDEQLKRFGSSADLLIMKLRNWGYSFKYLEPESNKLKDLKDGFETLNIHNVLCFKANNLDRINGL